MADSEETVSPEEKLLKVIQGAGDGKQAAAAKPADPGRPVLPRAPVSGVAAASKVKTEAPVQQQSSPADSPRPAAKLKVTELSSEERKEGEPAQESGASAPVGKGVEPEKPESAVPGPSLSWARNLYRVVNQVLAGVSLLMLVLTVLQCWWFVRSSRAETGRSVVPREIGYAVPDPVNLPRIEELVAALEQKSPFGLLPEAGPGPGPGPVGPTTGWRAWAQKNLDLTGFSKDPSTGQREAIVVDRENNRMHILKIGDRLDASGKTVQVAEMGEDELTLSDGVVRVGIK